MTEDHPILDWRGDVPVARLFDDFAKGRCGLESLHRAKRCALVEPAHGKAKQPQTGIERRTPLGQHLNQAFHVLQGFHKREAHHIGVTAYKLQVLAILIAERR